MIPIAQPIIEEEEKEAVLKVLDSGMLAQGEEVAKFEKEFAHFIGVQHAVATSNGTTALHLALLTLDIGDGDEVITSSFSFAASANAILHARARPILADVRERDFNISAEDVERRVTSKTKAIMPVHLYGQPADMEEIVRFAKECGLFVVEDACQAHGARIGERLVGALGDVGCFSFYPTKNMTTGEGGMITTNDDKVAEQARLLRNQGMHVRYHHDIIGYNFRMTDIAAAIGRAQLRKLKKFNEIRRANACTLTSLLADVQGISTPVTSEKVYHVYHQYTIRVRDPFPLTRDRLVKALAGAEIGSALYYPVPIHKQKPYIKAGYTETLPISERLSGEVISLPVHPGVTPENIEYIATVIKKAAKTA